MLKTSTRLLLQMAYAFRDSNEWVRRRRTEELRSWRGKLGLKGTRRYVRYLRTLEI